MENMRPRGPRMWVLNSVSLALTALLLALFLSAARKADLAGRRSDEATERYVVSEMAAVAMKQGSDDLTTQVRLYAVTGDPAYLRAYFAQVASREREEAVETLERELADTDAYHDLEHALASSTELMELEYYAMVLVLDAEGGETGPGMEALEEVRLRPEDAALDAEGKRALAVSLTHGAEYQRYDVSIDEDVSRCIEAVRAERDAVQRENEGILARARIWQGLSAGLLSTEVFALIVVVALYVLHPISEYVRHIEADEPLPPDGAYELRYLADAYDVMYAQRKERDTLVSERIRALELLEREHTSLTMVHEMLHSGMWSMDFDERGVMTDVEWSAEFRRMLGYKDETDFPNRLESWSDLLPDDDRARVLKEYTDTIEDYTGQKTYDVEYQLRTKDRGWRWFHAVGRLSRREDGTPITYVGLFADITDEREMAEELERQRIQIQEALEKAQAADRAKTVFLMNMSHDIRTPMNAIIGSTDLALRHVGDTEAVREHLRKISVSSRHLLALIDGVLEMSRMESGQLGLQERSCSLRELLDDVETMVRTDADAKRMDLSVDMTEVTDGDLVCDRTKLEEILLNVLSNALKFTPEGGTIRVRARQTGRPVEGIAVYEFRIRDSGIGMGREFQEHLFEPFARERTSTVSGIQGVGLGMAITKDIVDQMRGQIAVESEEGRGTEITVTLPLRVDGDARPDTGPEEAGEAPSLVGRRILLVEDNEINQEIARMVLEEAGLTVDTADDGSVAVEKIRDAGPDQYDLILMDLQMPVMDGHEATRQIRAMGTPLSRIPIVALSANALAEDRERSLEAGMDDHIGKPFDVEGLLDTIRRHLGRMSDGRKDGGPGADVS